MSADRRWADAIVAARESVDTLARCIGCAFDALRPAGADATVDVLVNGNRALAEAAAGWATALPLAAFSGTLRLWFIAVGDKAHAFNSYVHRIAANDASAAFFIDGYVELRADALARLAQLRSIGPRSSSRA